MPLSGISLYPFTSHGNAGGNFLTPRYDLVPLLLRPLPWLPGAFKTQGVCLKAPHAVRPSPATSPLYVGAFWPPDLTHHSFC